jgi:hypothetical protein
MSVGRRSLTRAAKNPSRAGIISTINPDVASPSIAYHGPLISEVKNRAIVKTDGFSENSVTG